MAKRKTTGLNDRDILMVSKAIDEVTSGMSQFSDSMRETARVIAEITSSTTNMVSSFSEISSLIKEIGSFKSQDKENGENIASGVGSMADAASGITGNIASASQGLNGATTSLFGSIMSGVGATTGVVGGIIGIFNRRKLEAEKYRREIEKALMAQLAAEVELGVATANRLADEKSITREKYKQIEANRQNAMAVKGDVIDDINKAIRESEEKLDGRYSAGYKRKERDFRDALLALRNHADDLDWLNTVGDNPLMAASNEHYDEYMSLYNRLLSLAQAQEDWLEEQESLLEEMIGSTAKDLADSWIEAFEKGEAATWDFAKNFQQMMRTAIINSFADTVILAQIEPVFNAFKEKIAAYLSDKLELEDVVTPELEEQISQTADKIKKLSPALTAILEKFGLEVSSSQADTLSSSIRGVSEETASVVAGQMNAIRSNQVKSMDYFSDSLLVLNKIENNTRYCRHLENIDRRIESIAQGLSFRVQGL